MSLELSVVLELPASPDAVLSGRGRGFGVD